jgi:aryl sulfotransferase
MRRTEKTVAQHKQAKFAAIVDHCTFDYMKAHAELAAPAGGIFWEGGAQTFIHKGTNGRWRDTLRPQESRAYEAKALAELGRTARAGLAAADRKNGKVRGSTPGYSGGQRAGE